MSTQSTAQAQLKMRIPMGESAHRNFQFDYLTSRTTPRMRPHAPSRSKYLYLDGNMYDSSMSARSLLSAAITFNKSLTDSIPWYRFSPSSTNK
jgi:hypothetical protein